MPYIENLGNINFFNLSLIDSVLSVDNKYILKQKKRRMLQRQVKNLPATSKVLLIHENYVIKMLEPSHKEAAVEILTAQFQKEEPLSNAYYRSYPLEHHKRVQQWRNFWRMFAQDSMTNKMSVGCFDAEKNDELVAVSVAKDLHYAPDGFEELYMKDLNFISPIIRLQQYMISRADEKLQAILSQRGVLMDIWGAAIKRSHFGKRILSKMMGGNLLLGQEAGFAYSFCYASNFKTALTLSRLHFHKISDADAKSFEAFGVRPFEKIDEPQSCPSLWIKKLDSHLAKGRSEK